MDKYPLDAQAIQDIVKDILQHNISQMLVIQNLTELLESAMASVEDEDEEWYKEAEKIVKAFQERKIAYENHRFNQKNGYGVNQNSPGTTTSAAHSVTPPTFGAASSGPIDLKKEAELNALEAGFGPEMDEEDIARHFGEKKSKKKKKQKPFKKMTLEEIKAWEEAQDNSNDIYKISARVKNLAREGGASLTNTGDMLTNTYVHVLKALYDFAETISDKETKIRLIELVRKNENMPANFIAAVKNGPIKG